MGRGLVRAIIILGDMMCSKKRFIPVILQVACALALLLGSSMSLALRAAGIRRSNLFQTDLSLTPVTYLSKLLGTPCVAAFSQLELFRVLISLCGNNLLHFRYRFAIDGVA